ncbi:MAG: hypothetical protein Q8P26_01015 [Candidatus Levybacteria bacterium]|nr:hypothetical protein [Candidatus Levybacteria bacterium]
MDPNTQEEQYSQKQEESKKGWGSRSINAVNNLRRARMLQGPFNKVGTRLAFQAGRSLITFLITSPAGWVTLCIILILVSFFMVFASLGGPLGIPNANTEAGAINQLITPSPTITPKKDNSTICERKYYESADCSGTPVAFGETNCQINISGCSSWAGSGTGTGTTEISSCVPCSNPTPIPVEP